MKFQVTLNTIPPASFRAHLIVSVGLPHAGLLHVPSSLLELHAAKDPVAGVTAAHATPAPPTSTAPVAAARAALLAHAGRGALRDPRGPAVLHPAAVRPGPARRNGGISVGIAAAPGS